MTRSEGEEHKQDEKPQQNGGEYLAEAVDDVAGVPAQVEGDAEEHQAEDDRRNQRLRADEGCDGR